MLSKQTHIHRDQIEMIALDQLVPTDHLVRKMEAALDFSFISGMFGSITWRKRTIFVIHKRIKASTLDERKPLNACLPMLKRSVECDGQP